MKVDALTLYLISGLLAFIPVAVWLSILFRKSKKRSIQILIFAGSIFTVVPVFMVQIFLIWYPQFDMGRFFAENIGDRKIYFLLLYILVGMIEEIVKQSIVRAVDRRYLLIQTINESIQYSLVAALGFSFAENIFYLVQNFSQIGIQQLLVMYLFRSIFTTCAHMLFSGIFGYYYGIAKFSINIVEQSRWTGKKARMATWVGNKLAISTFEAYKQITILRGALIAIFAHAIHNYLYEYNLILPGVIFVVVGFLYLLYLLKKRTGRLILVSDFSKEGQSSMPKKDEDVVIELMGMWFKEKRFVDVIHICQRLLQRDPGNKVVQLFKAKAIDNLGSGDAYGNILQKLFPDKKKESLAAFAKKKNRVKTTMPSGAPVQPMLKPADPPAPKTPGAEKQSGFYDLKL